MKKQKQFTLLEHKNLLIAAGVAAVAGVGIYVYTLNTEPDLGLVSTVPGNQQIHSDTNTNSNKPGAKAPAAGDTSQLHGKNIMNVGPQKAGNQLIVDLVNLVKPGYIAVYSANSKGEPGSLVSVSPLIKAGTSQDLVVKTNLKANTTYVIELRNDDGDSKFNAAKDLVLFDASGDQVMVNITASK